MCWFRRRKEKKKAQERTSDSHPSDLNKHQSDEHSSGEEREMNIRWLTPQEVQSHLRDVLGFLAAHNQQFFRGVNFHQFIQMWVSSYNMNEEPDYFPKISEKGHFLRFLNNHVSESNIPFVQMAIREFSSIAVELYYQLAFDLIIEQFKEVGAEQVASVLKSYTVPLTQILAETLAPINPPIQEEHERLQQISTDVIQSDKRETDGRYAALAQYRVALFDLLGGYFPESLDHAAKSLRLCEQFELDVGRARNLQLIGYTKEHLREWQEAFACYEEALPAFYAYDSKFNLLHLIPRITRVAAKAGRIEEALQRCDEGLRFCQRVPGRWGSDWIMILQSQSIAEYLRQNQLGTEAAIQEIIMKLKQMTPDNVRRGMCHSVGDAYETEAATFFLEGNASAALWCLSQTVIISDEVFQSEMEG
jgi:tetratricopeptide (TPR) repeat protein